MEQKRPVVVVIGTRPEAIKMIPVYTALQAAQIPTVLCCTMQHTNLVEDVFAVFGVQPDITLDIMRPGQDLFYLTQAVLLKTKKVFDTLNPALVMVHGDTTTTLAAALSAFYSQIPVAHVEAGLRTSSVYTPFPEEMNRRVVGRLASVHYAPTSSAVDALHAEGIAKSDVVMVGNTVVDALRIMHERIEQGDVVVRSDIVQRIANWKHKHMKSMLLTVHRRESLRFGLIPLFTTIKKFLLAHPDVVCLYPYHPNPKIIQALERSGLHQLNNCIVSEPLSYHDCVYVQHAVDVVVTDSGGLQEEAVSLGKQVLVLREETERTEGVQEGYAHVVGTDGIRIEDALRKVFHQAQRPQTDLYGDGYAAHKIVTDIQQRAFTCTPARASAMPVEICVQADNKRKSMKQVAVIGLGYIGLPTAVTMAEAGIQVHGFDVDQNRVVAINAGEAPIVESGLYEKLQTVVATGDLVAATHLVAADYYIIAVPTPFTAAKKADLSYVLKALRSVAQVIKKGDVVLIESTISVGATKQCSDLLHELTGMVIGRDIFVAHCPERVLPGNMFHELVHNDRVVGGVTAQCAERAAELYRLFVEGAIHTTTASAAEMVKLIENSARDVELAFAHQVAAMAHQAKIDPYELIGMANKHPRVNILRPSVGVGGHCIAVDPWFLIDAFPHNTQLLQAARAINDAQPSHVLKKIKAAVTAWKADNGRACRVAALGVTYKPNVDDLRESPALHIANQISSWKDVALRVADPHVSQAVLQGLFGECATTIDQAVLFADVVLILVAHSRFAIIDTTVLSGKHILDFCGILHKKRDTQASSAVDQSIQGVFDRSKEHNKKESAL